MESSIIVTYRCNARCQMCNRWMQPSKIVEEISPKIMDKIPPGQRRINLTGGEPALREDLLEIVSVLNKKTGRLEISTNGFFTERLVAVGKKFPNVTFRISAEGLPRLNDSLRGIKDGFDRGLRTVLRLLDVGVKDVGFGIVISDQNKQDLLDLYGLCSRMDIEFGNSTLHNSFYFNKQDNVIKDTQGTIEIMKRFIESLLNSERKDLKLRIKDWGRAYINFGLMKYMKNEKRPLPCCAGEDLFFLDPFGNILVCNGSVEPWIMGNLKKDTFEQIWKSQQAATAREKVKHCDRNCWMVGTAVPAMARQPWTPLFWVIKNKIKLMLNKDIWL